MRAFGDFQKYLKPLSKSEKLKLSLLSVLFCAASFLDLIGVVFLALAGASVLSTKEPDQLESLNAFHLSYLSNMEASQLAFVGLVSILLKSILSFWITKKIFAVTKLIQIRFTELALVKVKELGYQKAKKRISSGFDSIITDALSSLVIHVYGYFPILFAEISVLVVLGLLFLFVNAKATIVIGLGLILIVSIFVKYTSSKSRTHNREWLENSMALRSSVHDLSNNLKFLKINKLEDFFYQRILAKSENYADSYSRANFYQHESKFLIEFLMLGILTSFGFVSIFFQFESVGPSFFLITLSASFRILPSLIRLQNAAVMIRGSKHNSELALSFLSDNSKPLNSNFEVEKSISTVIEKNSVGVGIDIENLEFFHDENIERHFYYDNIHIKPLAINLIKGRTGTGKTTLLDLISGLIQPVEGLIKFNIDIKDELKIGYMSQDTNLFDGSFLENVTFKKDLSPTERKRLEEIIRGTHLSDLLVDWEGESKSNVGDIKTALSGGQRQRIGLARAMFLQPTLLLLDEPTNSVDEETRDILLRTLIELSSTTTIVIISHDKSLEGIAQNVIEISERK
jgi:ATP-binding cassette subfamily C protein